MIHNLRRTIPRMAPLVVAAAAVLALPACGSDNSSKSATASAAASGAGKKSVSVAMQPVVTGIKFAQDMTVGMKAAAADDGAIKLTVQGPPMLDAVAAQKVVTDLLSQNPNGIGISPFPAELWHRTMQTVKERVPNALAFNIRPSGAPADVPSTPIKTFIGMNDVQIAKAVAAKTIELAKLGPDTKGYALVAQCTPGKTGSLADRTTGFKAVIAQKLPNVQVRVFYPGPDPQGNTKAWRAELQANPNPVLTLGACDQDTTSVYLLKKSSGAKFPSGAMETPPEAIKGVEDGSILVTGSSHWYTIGYVATTILGRGARGDKLPEGWIDPGFTLVTKDNVAEIAKRDSSVAETKKWYTPQVKQILADVKGHTQPMANAFQ